MKTLTAVWYDNPGQAYFIPGTMIETPSSRIFVVDVKNDNIFVTDANGKILNDSAVSYTGNMEITLRSIFQNYGIQIDGTQAVEKDWSVGDNIPEWGDYTKIQ